MNYVSSVDTGFRNIVNSGKLEFALLKTKAIVDEHGATTGYRATLAITRDATRYVKTDGEIVTAPNLGEVITVNVRYSQIPEIKTMVAGVKLVNPTVHSVYATSAPDSSFAQIHWSITADNIVIANEGGNGK